MVKRDFQAYNYLRMLPYSELHKGSSFRQEREGLDVMITAVKKLKPGARQKG